jgi:DNA polymerase lambda
VASDTQRLFLFLFQASKLVNDGYTNIDQVLRDVKIGEVELDRNQLVGVECYEDILEKMGVEEVEKIGAIICDTVKKLYPSAEARIMGSYRRGKESCGDVDIHVTHPEYEKQVPEEALGKIVDTLWREEHISFHLTYLPGMETGYGYESDHKSSRYVPEKAWENNSKEKASPRGKAREGRSSSSSYMGVFNSPTETNKRRRVDIKFYPYRERIFAALYFTGNGHFNRSMRLLAARQFDFTLNDHGLFKRGTQDRVMEEASHEKEVFDKLGIQYREPEDRDCFDAVVPKAGSKSDLEMDQTELRKDNEHVWID